MLSKEAKKAKNDIIRSLEVDTTPLTITRKEWNDFALTASLPDDIVIEKNNIQDMNCEYIKMKDNADKGLVIMFHGGGYVTGSCITHRLLAARLVLRTGYTVLLFDYGLAPEHPFPYAINQAIELYKTLSHNNIVFMGDSAGGGLAVATMMKIREEGLKQPAKAILLSPWADLTLTGKSMKSRYEQEPMLTLGDLAITAYRYLHNENPTNPLVSPIFGDLTGLPKCLIHVGDHEVLLDDSTRLYDKMVADHVDVTMKIWPELWHCFQAWDIPEANKSIDEIAEFILNK